MQLYFRLKVSSMYVRRCGTMWDVVEAKTGTGPILLTCSFPYVRDWLNEHPFKNESNAKLICNLYNGAPITADSLWTIMKQLRKRIIRLIETGSVTDNEECQKLEYLLKPKNGILTAYAILQLPLIQIIFQNTLLRKR
jgi:hypothetical protein